MATPTDYELRRASEFMRELNPGQNWTEVLAQLLADHRELCLCDTVVVRDGVAIEAIGLESGSVVDLTKESSHV